MNIFYLQYIIQKSNLNFSLLDKSKVNKQKETRESMILIGINTINL